MNQKNPLVAVTVLLATPLSAAVQIGDLRLPQPLYSGSFTYFDPSSPVHTTRSVAGAPVSINSDFIAVTQNQGGTSPDTATDIGLQTYFGATTIRQLNRFAADPDGPGAAGGPQRVGAVQWSIDLSPLDSYILATNVSLTTLDLRILTDPSDDSDKEHDFYLSYTNPAEIISLAGLGASGDDNYDNFWWPAQTTAEGSIANGTHKVIGLNRIGNQDITIDLLSLYNQGVTDLNLIMSSGSFLSGRNVGILDGSGIYMAIPEPTAPLVLSSSLVALIFVRRRH